MIKWLRDSYNGIYKILLKPHNPSRQTVFLIIAGFLIGLLVGYAIDPVQYYDADPSTLQQGWQDEWVKMLADRAAAANGADLSANIVQLLQAVDDPVGIIDSLTNTEPDIEVRNRLFNIRELAVQAQENAATAPQITLWASIRPWLLGVIILFVLTVIVSWLWGVFDAASYVRAFGKRLRGEKDSEDVIRMRARSEEARKAEGSRTDFAVTTQGKPMMQRMSSYIYGYGEYDESYSIENEDSKFFGECGAAVSETSGDKATAIEVWVFDKAGPPGNTTVKVFASENAFNDPVMRARLQGKGDEVVLAKPGNTLNIDTDELKLQARVAEVDYANEDGIPPNSAFRKLTLEIAAWHTGGGGGTAAPIPAAVPAPIPVAPAANLTATATTPAYAPPPLPSLPPVQAAPSYAPPTPAGYGNAPARPAMPPPPQRPPDDDPFGGTGDFTPIS